MLTIVINYVCDCTIWGYYPLGIPAVLTAQYIILNLKITANRYSSYRLFKCKDREPVPAL